MWRKPLAILLLISLLVSVGSTSDVDAENWRASSGLFISSDDHDSDGDGEVDEEPFTIDWATEPPGEASSTFPTGTYGDKLKNPDTGTSKELGFACVWGYASDPYPASDDDCFMEELSDNDGYESDFSDAYIEIDRIDINLPNNGYVNLFYGCCDSWAYSGGAFTFYSNNNGPWKVPQDIPLPVGKFTPELNLVHDGNVYTKKGGQIVVNPSQGDASMDRHKGVFLYVRMEDDTHDTSDDNVLYQFHNMVLSNGWWNNYAPDAPEHPPSPGIGITAVDQYDRDGNSEWDHMCTYHVKQGFLGGDSGNDKLDDLVTSTDGCSNKHSSNAHSVKNLPFGSSEVTHVDMRDPSNGQGGCVLQDCDINHKWGVDSASGIHDFGQYRPVGELAVGTEVGDDFEWWFICRGSMKGNNITVNGDKYVCSIPANEFGGNWMKIEDCRPGFVWKKGARGWDCYAKESEIMNVEFFNIKNVSNPGDGYRAGFRIKDSELQKFKDMFGKEPEEIRYECYMGEPGTRPGYHGNKELGENPIFGGDEWVLIELPSNPDGSWQSYTCIFGIIDKDGNVFEGSNDVPFKVDITHASYTESEIQSKAAYNTWNGFPFDISGDDWPEGSGYDEDPIVAFCDDYWSADGC